MSSASEGAGRTITSEESGRDPRNRWQGSPKSRRSPKRSGRPGFARAALRIMTAATLVAFVAAASLATSPAVEATPSHAPAAWVRVGPAARLPAHVHLLGAVPSGKQIEIDVVLASRDQSELAGAAAAVSSPSSRLYRHYLSPASFAQLFAPSRQEVSAVESELRARGLTVLTPDDHGFVLPVRGSAAAVGKAFRTRLLAVRLADGTTGRFATSAPAVPAVIASSVTAVIGLDNLGRPESFAATAHLAGDAAAGTGAGATGGARAPAPASPAAAGPHVCQRAAEFAPSFSAYTPDQIARAYGFDGLYASGNLGAGQTVAIFELEPFLLSDVAAFDECFFGRSHTSSITVLPIDGGQLPGPGSGEAALDVEEVSALAPAAHLDVYEAPQTFTSWIDEIAAIVSQDRASVVSTSWGALRGGADGGLARVPADRERAVPAGRPRGPELVRGVGRQWL